MTQCAMVQEESGLELDETVDEIEQALHNQEKQINALEKEKNESRQREQAIDSKLRLMEMQCASLRDENDALTASLSSTLELNKKQTATLQRAEEAARSVGRITVALC